LRVPSTFMLRERAAVVGCCLGLVSGTLHCGSGTGVQNACVTDQNGIQGGSAVIFLTVSDRAFTVGAADAGSTQPNITIENATTVTLTLNNVGTKPHDLVVSCQQTPNNEGCPMQSCFPPAANIAPVQPGQSTMTMFVAPFKEGAYQFISDLPGDTKPGPGAGEATGLVGEFLLM
jgi:hypothetical protein